MTDDESKTFLKMLDGHTGRLREQGCDTVQIFVTKNEPDGTTRYWVNGVGNWCARFGQVFLWVERERRGDSDTDNPVT